MGIPHMCAITTSRIPIYAQQPNARITHTHTTSRYIWLYSYTASCAWSDSAAIDIALSEKATPTPIQCKNTHVCNSNNTVLYYISLVPPTSTLLPDWDLGSISLHQYSNHYIYIS